MTVGETETVKQQAVGCFRFSGDRKPGPGLHFIAGLLLFIWFLPHVTQLRKNYCRGPGYFADK